MEERKLDKKFLKFCPVCKAYFPNIWKECLTCRKALKSLYLEYYVIGFFRKVIGALKIVLPLAIIISLCLYGTYGIQVKERAQYIRGFTLLINKKIPAGWEEIKGALIENPLYKYAKSLTGGVKGEAARGTKGEVIEGVKSNVLEFKKEQYILRDIFFDINSKKNSALINNNVVFEGDSMGDFKLIKVNIDSIDIEIKGTQENIKFGSIWN